MLDSRQPPTPDTEAPQPPGRWRPLHHPALYALFLAAGAVTYCGGLWPGRGEPLEAPAARPPRALEHLVRHPGEMPFGFGVAVLAPAVLGAGLLAGYVLLRAHNVRVFPRCEFPLVPWTAWHLLRVGIVLFAVARWVGLGIAWALHLQASRAAWSWLPTGPVVVGGGSLTTLLVCAFIVGLVAGGRESAFRLLGLWEPRPLRRAAVGVAGLLLVLPLVLLATVAALMLAPRIGLSARPQEVLLRIAGASPRALAFVLFSVVVLTPLAEELLFRGFFYATLRRYLGPLGAIVLSALTFALLHSHPVGVPPLFVIGFLLGYLYERTGSLAAPIAAHAAYNLYVLLLTHLARQELWG